MKYIGNIRVSVLFSLFILSLMIFEKGLFGLNLDPVSMLGYWAAYSIPIFILDMWLTNLIASQPERKFSWGMLWRCVLIAFLVAILWVVAIGMFYQPRGEEGMIYIVTPIAYLIFFGVSVVLSILAAWRYRAGGQGAFNIFSVTIITLCLAVLIYGIWAIAKCDGAGCGNREYLVERAVRENNPDVCMLAGRTENGFPGGSWNSYLIFSQFYGSNISDCYRDLAIKTNDISLCENAGYMKTSCYDSLALSLNDQALCEKGFDKDGCYVRLAVKNKDLSLCDKVVNSDNQKWCKSRVEEYINACSDSYDAKAMDDCARIEENIRPN